MGVSPLVKHFLQLHRQASRSARDSPWRRGALSSASGAVAQAKALVARVGRDATTRILDDGGRAVADSARRGEGAEGLKAFVEKRKPGWTGREG
jgi:hypothetical protein